MQNAAGREGVREVGGRKRKSDGGRAMEEETEGRRGGGGGRREGKRGERERRAQRGREREYICLRNTPTTLLTPPHPKLSTGFTR